MDINIKYSCHVHHKADSLAVESKFCPAGLCELQSIKMASINIIAWLSEDNNLKNPAVPHHQNHGSSTHSTIQTNVRWLSTRSFPAWRNDWTQSRQDGGINDTFHVKLGWHDVWGTARRGLLPLFSYWAQTFLYPAKRCWVEKCSIPTDIQVRSNGESVRHWWRRPTKKRRLEPICWSNIVYPQKLVKEFISPI